MAPLRPALPRSLGRACSALALLGLTSAVSGCDALKGLASNSITGTVQVDGEAPAAYKLTLYSFSKNQDAFDTSVCTSGDSGACLGRVDVSKLTTPVEAGEVVWTGNDFEIPEVPLDVSYILVAEGVDEVIVCTQDVVGYDEDSKLVTVDSAISIAGAELDGTELEAIALPRPVRLSCAAPATAPEEPESTDPGEEPEVDLTEDGDIPAPAEVGWSSFTVTDPATGTSWGDASTGSSLSGPPCNEEFPSVLRVEGTALDSGATEAYIRVQFGSGDAAEIRTFPTPISGGTISQDISLTGGYAVVQLDTNDALDGVGESYTISFCERDAAPAQELLTILTWDVDNSDVDTHIYNNTEGTEVAYYSMSQSWGDLDIDDTDGFGPETFTTTPGTAGNLYQIKAHYYSDHGSGPTTATMRVVYYDAAAGITCDFSASQVMNSYDWWDVATVGPGMACPGGR
jgi:hypothetical protein